MNRNIPIALLLIFFLSCDVFAQLEFIENQGQWHGNYALRAKMSHGDFWLSGNKVAFVLSDFGIKPEPGRKHQHPHGNLDQAKDHCYTIEFLGASSAVQLLGEERKSQYHNYFISKDSRNWKSRVGLYSVAIHNEIYPKTDLVWKEEKGNLKYEFRLQPGANPAVIRMQYKGLDKMELEKGRLALHTSLGKVTEQEPYAYQVIKGRTQRVSCRFKRIGNEVVTFDFPDGYETTEPLVIDPVLVFSTFSGSRSDNWGFSATYGENGTTYAAGIALGPHFPVTTGAFQPTYAGDSTIPGQYSTYDIGILKFSSNGDQLLFATYLGGAEADIPASLVIDNENNLVLLGATSSANFPTTETAYDKTYGGGSVVSPYGPDEDIVKFRQGSDIVVSKFSPDGTQLVGSTYLGGSGNDGVLSLTAFGNSSLVRNYGDAFRGEIAIDSLNRIYIASHTISTNFPTVTPLQASKGSGYDGICARFNPDLTALQFSTYLGGNGDDGAFSIQVGKQGVIYLAGGTVSSNFPRTAGGYKPVYGGANDGFACKFNPSVGLTSLRSTYIGTTAYDQAYFVQLDTKGQVYLFGQTKGNYPVSAGVYSNPNGGQFIHGLSPNLDSSRFSTVFGSGGNITNLSPTAFLVDDCGRIYCSGWGGTTNQISGYQNGTAAGLKTTANAFAHSTNGSEFYFLVLEKNASDRTFATYFGDTLGGIEHVDGGTSRFDKRGIVYQSVCAGCGGQSSFPTTPGVYSNTNRSVNCNNAVFKYDFSLLKAGFQSSVVQACAPAAIKFTSNSIFANSYRWDFGTGQPAVTVTTDTIQYTYDTAGTFQVKLVAINPDACPGLDSIQKTIIVQKVPDFAGDSVAFCSLGDTLQLPQLPAGSFSYSWLPASGLSNAGIRNPKVLNPQQSIVYQATVRSSFGCEKKNTFKVSNAILTAKAAADTLQGCKPLSIRFFNRSFQSKNVTWFWGDGDSTLAPGDTSFHTFNQAGNYRIVMKAENDTTCEKQQFDTLNVVVHDLPVFGDTLNRFCVDGSFQLNGRKNIGKQFHWSPSSQLNDSTLKNPMFQNVHPQVFTLSILDSNQCNALAKVEVRDGRLKSVFDLSTLNPCVPASINLNNQSLNAQRSRWIWNTDSLEVDGNGIIPLIGTQTGNFKLKLKVLSDTACSAFDVTEHTIVLGGVPIILPSTITFCPGDSVLISAFKLPGYQYLWPTSARILADPSKANIFGVDTLQLSIGLKDSLQCPGIQNITMIPSKPKADFGSEDRFEICIDALKARFTALTEDVGYSWLIDGQNFTGKSVDYQFPNRGIYSVQLSVNKSTCRDTILKPIEINNAPLLLEARFEADPVLIACNELPILKISNQSVGATKIIWSWDSQVSYETVPEIKVKEAGTLRITLDAYQGLCLRSITKEIDVGPISPPNLITVNGDDKNDRFVIQNLPENAKLEVRNRWGEEIFRSSNYKNDWQPVAKFETVFYDLRLPGGEGCNGWIQIVK